MIPMNPILYNYHVNKYTNSSSKYLFLCILHELRIVSKYQMIELLNFSIDIKENGVTKIGDSLFKDEMIEKFKESNRVYYFLTKRGYQSIGGYYSLPKVPEYNLAHHLEINDYLISVIKRVKDMPSLKYIQSERRIVFETKDYTENSKGKKYFVPDFICRFLTKEEYEVDWCFEIELTLKSRHRYMKGIFPKYIKQLKKFEEEHLLYVTPSPIIKQELELYRQSFEIDDQVYNRLHIMSADNFNPEFTKLLTTDPYINW